jgi:ribosomal protein S18 acetylase RimI-like enzyme
MIITLKVDFKPSTDQLYQVKAWLIEEENTLSEGFFCNWRIIQDSFENQKICILLLGKKAIGFMTWFERDKVTTIQITEIRPGFRQLGYGRYLTNALTVKLAKQGFVVLELHCQPAKSEKAWKKLGFKQYPDVEGFTDYNISDGKHLYKILVPHLKPTKSKKEVATIELWNVEPYQIDKVSSLWKWHPKVNSHSSHLEKPLIFPAKRDWNIRWSENGIILREEKVKYFGKSADIDFTNFIVIEKLP